VEDLKKRLVNYELRGAAASVELQRTARAVDEENRRLRTLLAMHGVSQGEISHFLASGEADGVGAQVESSTRGGQIVLWNPMPSKSRSASSVPGSQQQNSAFYRSNNIEVLLPPSAMNDLFPPETDCFDSPQSSLSSSSSSLSATEPARNSLSETLETSCDTAAAILVGLHDQTDAARARIALGCSGTSSCSVNNIKIFQLMDKMG